MQTRFGPPPTDTTNDIFHPRWQRWFNDLWLAVATPSGPSSVGGSNTQIQYNSSGTFGASANFTYDPATNTLTFATPDGVQLQISENPLGDPIAKLGLASGKLGFFGSAGVVKPTVTGSRNGNPALASLLTAHQNLGLLVDSTTAGTAGGAVTQVAVTLTGIPYGTQYAQVTVIDANITPTSKIIIGWGNITDADENTPDFDDVRFTAVPDTGSMIVRLSCTSSWHRLGGEYKINYLIG